jgi:2-polyprenyl-3-methyl-5-hydroxy-6-metoxy-1,4-benzoquinol methylase
MNTQGEALKYDADVDLASDTAPSRVARLVGHDRRVLDLGCSTGNLAKALLTQGCKTTGVERDPGAAKIAQSVCEHVVVADLDLVDLPLELEGQRFDVIVAADVLEHLRDPVQLIKQLSQLLAPGGYLVVSFPNAAHGSVRLALLHGELPYADLGLLDRTHLQLLNRRQILELLCQGGFTPVHLEQTTLAIAASEVPFPDDDLTKSVFSEVESDPEASVYQYVVVAFAGAPEQLQALPHTLASRQRENEALAARLRTTEAALHEANLAAAATQFLSEQMQDLQQLEARIEGLVIELLDARDQVRRRERDLEVARHLEGAREHSIRESRDEVLSFRYRIKDLETELENIRASRLWRVHTAYCTRVAPVLDRLRGAGPT